jgi:hypothetical protein
MTLNQLVIALIINGFTSLITIVLGWDGTKYITKATSTNRTLLDFGKYTTFTLMELITKRRYFNYQFESNGSAAVALYSIL